MLSYFVRLAWRFIQARTGGPRRRAVLMMTGGLLGGMLFNGATHEAVAAEAPSSAPAAEGAWAGVLSEDGAQVHIVLTITRLSSGEYTAELNSVDQGAALPVNSLTMQGRTVDFEVKSVGGTYKGKLNDSGTELDGTWKQAGGPSEHLVFKRSSTSVVAAAPATAPGPTEKPLTIPLEVRVPVAPAAFRADGKYHLVYELHVTNMGQWNCLLSGLEVTGEHAGSRTLARFSQANLESMIRPSGTKAPEKSRLAPGAAAVVYMWITVDRREDLPAMLQHRLSVKLGDYPQTLALQTHPVPVGSNTTVIGPPLRGDHWVAVRGPSNTSGHRRALVPIQGRATIAERFAIDWIRLDDGGQPFHGDPLDNKNYYAFGAEALAVADGVVAEEQDGVPLNVPGDHSRTVAMTLENLGGNYIVLDIGNGHYAFYAHLQPGSLRVKLGDRVRRGQVIGLVGNTGNSTGPHLHFHISDATSPLGGEGLPWVLTSFEVEGHNGELKAGKDGKSVREIESLPTENEVVRFPATP